MIFVFLVLYNFSNPDIRGSEPIKSIDTLQYIMGKFEPAKHPLFTKIPSAYSVKTEYLRKETLEAFIMMANAAQKDGIKLKILSATRNFNAQKTIWENKWTGKTLVGKGQNLAKTQKDPVKRAQIILEYSSMPSTSRHHWGTDMDLNSLSNDYFASGEGKKIYDWLTGHAAAFGFCQPYTAGRLNGYHEEKWHWTYMPVSKPLTDFCQKKMFNNKITGFLGSQTAPTIDIVKKYMLGINPECL
ncbi:MAG: M15 family metallopeptidase [Saprospiraceae bacterium]